MREIRFRAWDKNAEAMRFDYIGKSGDGPGDWVLLGSADNPFDRRQIDLMQYTGLKDKNGMEIYEGDILYYLIGESTSDFKPDSGVKIIVEWRDGAFVNSKTWELISEEITEWPQLEVIGNIHQNPELLK